VHAYRDIISFLSDRCPRKSELPRVLGDGTAIVADRGVVELAARAPRRMLARVARLSNQRLSW
jgi:hypothetical protein